jgi:hypothetical protein
MYQAEKGSENLKHISYADRHSKCQSNSEDLIIRFTTARPYNQNQLGHT